MVQLKDEVKELQKELAGIEARLARPAPTPTPAAPVPAPAPDVAKPKAPNSRDDF